MLCYVSVRGKPEKLETLNEGKIEDEENTEANTLTQTDKKSLPNPTNLQPGQSFFFLNGEPLYQNYAFQNTLGLPNFGTKFQQPLLLPTEQDLDLQYNTYPFHALLLRNEIPKDAQGHFINPHQQNLIVKKGTSPVQDEQKISEQIPLQIQQNNPQAFNLPTAPINDQSEGIPSNSQLRTAGQQVSSGTQPVVSQEQQLQNQVVPQFFSPEQGFGIETRTFPQEVFFKNALPFSFDGEDPNFEEFGQFRFSPPSAPYYPADGEDIENDSVVIEANLDDASPSSNGEKAEIEGILFNFDVYHSDHFCDIHDIPIFRNFFVLISVQLC